MKIRKQSVCIIGAGPAGLCAIRHFSAKPEQFGPIVCYEQTDKIGGTWNYVEEIDVDSNGLPVHTSMYRDLRINGPVESLGFLDFPLRCSRSYVRYDEILNYLQQYCEHFNCERHIRFCTQMTHVNRDAESGLWKVSLAVLGSQNDGNDNAPTNRTEYFDVIVLCLGRFWSPKWPFAQIAGLKRFRGSMIHSKNYRYREPYRGQTVAIVGAGFSGADIALEISTVSPKVILINTTDQQYARLPSNIIQIKGNVYEFTETSMLVVNIDDDVRQEFAIDSVILATGYRLNLDYLDLPACGLRQNLDQTVSGVFRHFINIEYPTMAILSIAIPSITFSLFQQQIRYFIATLCGDVALPNRETMLAEVAEDLERTRRLGIRDKDRHVIRDMSLASHYLARLERDARLPDTVPPVIFELFDEFAATRASNPAGYRDINYRLIDDQRFEVISGD